MHFAMTMATLHSPDVYWNYPKKIENCINSFSWKLFVLFCKRHLSFIERFQVILLCRISYFLWRISPEWENKVFRSFSNAKIMGLTGKLTFVTKY